MAANAPDAPFPPQGAERTEKKRIVVLNHIAAAFRTLFQWRVPEGFPQHSKNALLPDGFKRMAMA
jgi:hypothetical protein